MKEGLCAVTLDPYGDSSHYESRECLDPLHLTTCVVQSLTFLDFTVR